MRKGRGLVEEQVLDDDAFHRFERGIDMLGVGVRLRNILALDEDPFEAAIDGGIQHVRNAKAGLRIEMHVPQGLELVANNLVRNMTIAGELMRE